MKQNFKEGDAIMFKHDLIEQANEDHPKFLLAKKGEIGVLIRRSESQYGWLVQPTKGNPFYINESEIDLISK